ncbi:kinase-like domain-containing protein [Cytidiella melzeri]|nr:kinase-like domain-containing protein [Cytidiella melzeri]
MRSNISSLHPHHIQNIRNATIATSSHSVGQPEWAAHEEPISDYNDKTGYLPLTLGQELGEYRILRKLGWGVYSTVWLAQRQRYVLQPLATASVNGAHEPQLHEIDFLQRMRDRSPFHPFSSRVIHLVDHFYCPQSRRDHLCLVLEPLSQSLHSLSKRWVNSRLPSCLVRHVIRQVVEGLDYLHTECNIIHTDVKADNVMLTISPGEIQAFLDSRTNVQADKAIFPDGRRVIRSQSTPIAFSIPTGDLGSYATWKHVNAKLADVGVSCWADSVNEHFTDLIQSPALRAPEVCIGAGWGKPVDIWSVGCLAYQLLMGYSLVNEKCDQQAVPYFHASFFGKYPPEMVKRGKYSDFFYKEDAGSLRIELDVRVTLEEMIMRAPPADVDTFIDFVKCTFTLDPSQRPTAHELLKHKWLQLE